MTKSTESSIPTNSDEPDFATIICLDRVCTSKEFKSRAAVLRNAGKMLSPSNQARDSVHFDKKKRIDSSEVAGALLDREQKGSTALDGSGAAIPHCRLESCIKPIGCLIKLEAPVKFAEEDVDLVFALVVPEVEDKDKEEDKAKARQHLRILQVCVGIFSDEANMEALRACRDAPSLHELFLKFGKLVQSV